MQGGTDYPLLPAGLGCAGPSACPALVLALAFLARIPGRSAASSSALEAGSFANLTRGVLVVYSTLTLAAFLPVYEGRACDAPASGRAPRASTGTGRIRVSPKVPQAVRLPSSPKTVRDALSKFGFYQNSPRPPDELRSLCMQLLW